MKRSKVKCKKCGREISKSNILRHENSCAGKTNKTQYKFVSGKCVCDICGKTYTKKGIGTHIWRQHGGGAEHNPNTNRVAWNKGLTKETDSRLAEWNKKMLQLYESGKIKSGFIGKSHSERAKEKISKALSKNNHGGRCKWYKVSGIYVQGTWERDLARHMNILGIKWTKIKTNSHTFQYVMEGKKRHYTPDFKLDNFNILLELKGYWWGNDKEKMRLVVEQNNIPNLYIIEEDKYKKLLKSSSIDEFTKIIKPT